MGRRLRNQRLTREMAISLAAEAREKREREDAEEANVAREWYIVEAEREWYVVEAEEAEAAKAALKQWYLTDLTKAAAYRPECDLKGKGKGDIEKATEDARLSLTVCEAETSSAVLFTEGNTEEAREAAFTRNARKAWRRQQVESNFAIVAALPDWQKEKGNKNAYVMVRSVDSGNLRPIILVLDFYYRHPWWRSGGLTYYSLCRQIRETLQIQPHIPLRLWSDRPWYKPYMDFTKISEDRIIDHKSEEQCRHLFGTTLLWLAGNSDNQANYATAVAPEESAGSQPCCWAQHSSVAITERAIN